MEEIITVDGRQFKLTVDRPLTATEKAQTLAEIRKQTGCGTCGPKTLSRGGVYSLPFGNDGAGTYGGVGPKGSGSIMTLSASPTGGVAPYDIRFWKSLDGVALTQTNITGATQLAQPEVPPGPVVTATYTIVDTDVAGALGNLGALAPSDVNTTTGAITLLGGAAALAVANIRFYTSIIDSCPGAGGRGTCAQYVDVAMVCVAPTCGFVVT